MALHPKTISIHEAAKRLGISNQTVREWCKKGHLHYLKYPTGRYKVFEEDVEKILKQKIDDKDISSNNRRDENDQETNK